MYNCFKLKIWVWLKQSIVRLLRQLSSGLIFCCDKRKLKSLLYRADNSSQNDCLLISLKENSTAACCAYSHCGTRWQSYVELDSLYFKMASDIQVLNDRQLTISESLLNCSDTFFTFNSKWANQQYSLRILSNGSLMIAKLLFTKLLGGVCHGEHW